MKTILLVFVLLSGSCLASERPRMAREFSGEQEALELLESVARTASSGDFDGFIKCFTSKYASGIRRKMKAAISDCDVEMEILGNQIQSFDEKSISMRTKYSWDNGSQKTLFTSDIVARMEGGAWRIASESIVSAKKAERTPPPEFNFAGGGQVAFSNDDDVLPLDIARTSAGGCAGGRCGVPLAPQAVSPDVNQPLKPNFDVLPLDIARRPGGGCAGGRCGL